MCTCVCVCVFARQGHRTISHSYVSPGEWTQVWRLTSRAITGSGMSYKFKIWNLWAPCFSQSWVLESQAYATIPIVYLHTADYSQKACSPPHTPVHICARTYTRVHTRMCKHTHAHTHANTHVRTCTQLLLLPQSVIIRLPWFLLHLSGPVPNHPLLNEC